MFRPRPLDLDRIDGESLMHHLSARPGELDRAIRIGWKLDYPRYIGDWSPDQCREVVARMGRIRAGVN